MVYSPYFPQGAIRIYPETVAQRMEGLNKPVTLRDNLEKGIARRTLPSKYWASEFDKGPYLRDETWMEFVQWRMMGEEDQTIEYVPEGKSVGIMIPTKGRCHPANIVGVTLSDSWIDLNMREVGKYLSLHENFRQHMINYMRSEEGQALAAKLGKLGYKAEDIEYTAVGFIPGNAIYGVGRLPNGKVVIYANESSSWIIEREAEGFGMRAEELREAAIGEEFAHIFRRSYDKAGIPEEKATKAMLMDFYKTLSDSTTNARLKEKYSRIIRHLEVDIATIARYAQLGSKSLEELVDIYNADVGELVESLKGEALYNGINTVEGVKGYVCRRLEEIAKAAKKEGSEDYKGRKTAKMEGSKETESSEGEKGDAEEGEVCAEAEGAEGDGGGESGGE